jgi:dihydroorotase
MKYDLILRSAHVIDPSQELDGVCDVAIKDGLIAKVGPALEASPDTPQQEFGEMYLAPGLVDLHGHWYEGSAFGVDPNRCTEHGVTTVVDAGTTGFINFEEFRRNCIEPARVRVLAFLNIAATGILTPMTGELLDLRIVRPKETAEVLLDHQQSLVGIKVRLGAMSANHAIEALDRALEAAEAARAPLMVHISKTAPTRDILDKLRPGDILTHCFQGRGDGLLPDGGMLPQAIEARERGVVFDVGHGCGSFSWNTAKAAFEQFFFPDTISTDLHRFSIERWCIDMPTTMSKFLHLGMSLKDVVSKTTWMPARALRREAEIGTLQPGAVADLFTFSIEEGEFPLEDTHMKVVMADRMIRVNRVMKAGRWVDTRDARPLRKLRDCDYEVFRTLEESA